MRTLGIDIGGSSVKAALLDGEIITTARSGGYANPSREGLIHAVQEAVHLLGEPVDQTTPVGLCLPGKRSASGDRVVHSINLPCLNDWVFSEMLGSMLGFDPGRARFVTDIHATAIDLVLRRSLNGRVAIIAIGTGVGFAMIEDGELVPLNSPGSGNLGALEIESCGESGTLESFVGARALRSRWGDDEAELIERLGGLGEDDPVMSALAQTLRVVIEDHSPDTIVLAGGVGFALAPRSETISQMVGQSVRLVFGDTLYHAAVGAARLAIS